jgi:hypothetical protein
MDNILAKNIAEARKDHTDRESINQACEEWIPYENKICDLLNKAIPGLNLRKELNGKAPFDLTNDDGLKIEIETGSWGGTSFPSSPNFTMNLLARKSYDRSDVFMKFDQNLKSAFILVCKPIVAMVRTKRIVPVENYQEKIKGTSDKVYKLSMDQRNKLSRAGMLLMVKNGNYKEIEPFLRNNGFLKNK